MRRANSGHVQARFAIFQLLIAATLSCADASLQPGSEPVAVAVAPLAPVTCPTGTSAEVCSGDGESSPACFVALGQERLRKEVAQTFRVSREGNAGRVTLVLKRLFDVPEGTTPELIVELRKLLNGKIPPGSSSSFARARVSAAALELGVDTPMSVLLTSAPDAILSPGPPEDPNLYAIILRVEEPGLLAIGAACHDDPLYASGRAWSRQMRKTGATTFSAPAFTPDTRDLTFALTLGDGCITGATKSCGVGGCFRTVDQCIAGVEQTCVPGDPVAEICNGVDDDCDGLVDEISDLGTISCGVGACRRTYDSCANGALVICVEGLPSAEQCNGIDDDCDGLTDEVIDLGTTTCGDGRCRRTMDNCLAGSPQACTPDFTQAQVETCNAIDDDCDALTDEDASGVPLTRPYWPGSAAERHVGACTDGVEECAAVTVESWNVTVPPILSTAETCNSIDDDCDGLTDESLVRSCWPFEAAKRGVGSCRDGSQNCVPGAPGTENYDACAGFTAPATETCNGADDDCNGLIDDGLGTNSCGQGRCRITRPTCVAGVIENCPPSGDTSQIQVETCNGIDDDCDGLIDEQDSGFKLERSCWTGDPLKRNVGLCRDGVQRCNSTTPDTESWDACSGETGPVAELCDSLDQDCTGTADDATALSMCGTPTQGTAACTSGACTVASCNTNYWNLNGTFGDGCECHDNDGAPASCSTPRDMGTLNNAATIDVVGVVPATGTADYVQVAVPLGSGWGQKFGAAAASALSISFASPTDSTFRFDVLAGPCAGTGRSCQTGTNTGLTSYSQTDNVERTDCFYYTQSQLTFDGGSTSPRSSNFNCGCLTNPGTGTNGAVNLPSCRDRRDAVNNVITWNPTFILKVYRTSTPATCAAATYTLRLTR